MTTEIRRWVQSHRYRVLVRQLKALPSTDLRALGIGPAQINHLAFEVSQTECAHTHRTIVVLLAVVALFAVWGIQ